MATKLEKLTKEQLSGAMKDLAKMFPEEAENIIKHHDHIVKYLFDNVDPPSNSPLSSLILDEKEFVEFTPCTVACATVIVDVVFFVLGLLGLRVSYKEKLTRALLRELGQDTIRGFARAIKDFSEAEGALNKAKALFKIVGGIYNAGGFRAVFKVIKEEMTWWEWVKTGVIAVAQLTAWLASDGAAFIAEAVLTIMSATQLIQDSIHCAQVCSS